MNFYKFREANFHFPQRGVSLYLALMILTILLGIALGISTVFLSQTKMMRDIGYSVIAFYAADAGIEKVLINRSNPVSIVQTPLSNLATYQVVVLAAGSGGCYAANFCIKSIGEYKETRRAIETQY